ncbi:MAG: transcriptional regulator [Actinomycetota bacterium]
MSETTKSSFQQAQEASSRGDLVSAYDLFVAADDAEPLGPDDLALLADAAYAAGHVDRAIESWERVHAANLSTGDQLGAAGAAVRVAMHLLMDTGLMAPVRGWTKRAERLLEGLDETPVHAWLAVARNYERLLSGDFSTARRWARLAVEIGTRQGEPAAVALGRVAEGRALIYEGEVQRGLNLLDEAAVATVSGELDPVSVGMLYCELLCACQALAQYDRAEEWTAAYERWRNEQGVGSLRGRCRVHRAELLRLRGHCGEAETEALLACEELRPYLRREFGWPLTELGRIRLRTADLEGAEEAFLSAHEVGWDPQPGLALLRLAQGDIEAAARSIRDAIDHPMNVPSKELPPNTELRRAPLLDAQVEIAVAAGDLERARWAAGELEKVAASFQSRSLFASAAMSRGRVQLADGEVSAARISFDEALQIWSEINAPFEAALARTGLAQAHRAEGDEDRALMEFRAATSTFERVGAVYHADSARQSVGEAKPVKVEADAAVFRREGDYWCVGFEEHTCRVRDLRGMHYLGRLLADPGREFHVVDLVTAVGEGSVGVSADFDAASAPTGDAGEMLDTRAKDEYRRRLADIDEDVEEARALGDTERAAMAAAERDFIVRELSRAVGLSGRDRRAGSASERARASVTQAVRHAMARIKENNKDLGEHLDRAVRTGTYCVYSPDPRAPVDWKL